MSENQKTPDSNEESELLRQIREGRKFSLGDAIGQMAGGDLTKGASPITRKRQAEFEIEHYLEDHLVDSDGALQVVLLRRIRESEHLLKNYDKPLVALLQICQYILASEYLLRALVNETDVEWGRIQNERPYFEQEGCNPHPDDPYTFASVRAVLTQLIEKLRNCEK